MNELSLGARFTSAFYEFLFTHGMVFIYIIILYAGFNKLYWQYFRTNRETDIDLMERYLYVQMSKRYRKYKYESNQINSK